MWNLHAQLNANRISIITGTFGQPLAQIRGLGGNGKTLLAREYAIRFAPAYPGGIFWLNAFGNDDSISTLSSLARESSRQDQIRAFAARIGLPTDGLNAPDGSDRTTSHTCWGAKTFHDAARKSCTPSRHETLYMPNPADAWHLRSASLRARGSCSAMTLSASLRAAPDWRCGRSISLIARARSVGGRTLQRSGRQAQSHFALFAEIERMGRGTVWFRRKAGRQAGQAKRSVVRQDCESESPADRNAEYVVRARAKIPSDIG